MKRTMIYLTLFLLVTSAWAGTYKEDFSTGAFGLTRPTPTNFGNMNLGVENRTLIAEFTQPWPPETPLFWPLNPYAVGGEPKWDSSWKDYTLETRTKLVSDEIDPEGWVAWGLGIRLGICSGINQGYFFLIDFHEQTTLIRKFFPGQNGTIRENISRRPFAAAKDVWYKLKVVTQGNHFQFYIDDKLIDEIDDDTIPEGCPALQIRNATVHFDWLILSGSEIPDVDNTSGPLEGVVAVVEPIGKLATTWGEVKAAQ